MIGRVVSTKQIRTAVVLVSTRKTDPMYQKSYSRTKRYAVDDPIGVTVGDLVLFIKVKPVSKNKHWRITKVIGRDIAEVVGEQLKKKAEETIGEVMPEKKEEGKNGTA